MVLSRAHLPLPLRLLTTTNRRLKQLNYAQSRAFRSVADHRASVLSAPTKISSSVQATKARSQLNPRSIAKHEQSLKLSFKLQESSRSKIAMGSSPHKWAKGGKYSRGAQRRAQQKKSTLKQKSAQEKRAQKKRAEASKDGQRKRAE